MSLPKCKRSGCFLDAVSHDGFCARCAGCASVQEYSRQNRLLPARKAPHVVLSFELETALGRADSQRALAVAHMVSCADCSVSGVEYKVSAPCCGTHRVSYELVAVAERASALGARIDSHCGLHVHLDRRGVPLDRVGKFLSWCIRHEEQFSACTPPRRWGGTYVQPYSLYDSSATFADLEAGYFGAVTHHHRWVNIPTSERKQTVEFRWHPGTLSPHKLRGYADFMVHLGHVFRAVDREFPALIEDVCPADSLGYEYIRARKASGGVLRTGRRAGGSDEAESDE